MLNGIDLTLMIGPLVPVPVPRDVLEALEEVQVESPSGETQAGFELTFSLPKRSPLETLFLLTGGSTIPILRVVIVVTVGGTATVLMDGVMTHHEVRTGGAGASSKLVIKGKDLTQVMDLIDFGGLPFPAMPPVVRVLTALAKYAPLGVIPLTVPSVVEDVPLPTDRIPRQQGTDYTYITSLARQCGYVFYLEPGPAPGTSRAYWGPEIRVGPPQPALNVDMDAYTNVEALSFSFDKEAKELPIVYIHNKETKVPIPIPIPDVSPLNPPLGAIPPLPPKLTPLAETANLSPLSAVMTGLAYAAQHQDSVTGTGSLNVTRYGRVLKSRSLVGVRGAGLAFDGLYFVKRVSHRIRRGEYRQEFTLVRNGLVSTVSAVPA